MLRPQSIRDSISPTAGRAERPWAFAKSRILRLLAAGTLGFNTTPLIKEYLRALVFFGAERPRPTGPFGVALGSIDAGGAPDGGSFPVDLVYPTDLPGWRATRLPALDSGMLARPTQARGIRNAPLASARATYPLLLYFPSWFSRRDENSFMLANLASHGYIIAAMDDVGRLASGNSSDRKAQVASLALASQAGFAAFCSIAKRRTLLEASLGSAIIDDLAASAYWGPRIDHKHIGALGFSFGGGVAAEISSTDPRITAAANLDGPILGDTAQSGVDCPYLTLLNGHPFPAPESLIQPDLTARFEAILDQGAIEHQMRQTERRHNWAFVVRDAQHLDFSDRLVMPSFWDKRSAEAVNRPQLWSEINCYIVAFFETYLRGTPVRSLKGTPAFAGITTFAQALVS